MQPPVKGRVTIGLDPGYRTGCKVAVVDATGKVLDTGVIYPTLDLLQDQGLISVADENGRKKIAITAEGSQLHAENQQPLEQIQARLQARMVGCELRKNPQMKRALENFKAVLDLKVNQQEITEAQLKQIVGVIDRAAMEISQLD